MNMSGLRGSAGTALSILGVFFLMFMAANFAAMIALDKPPEEIWEIKDDLFAPAIWPQTVQGQALLTQTLGKDTAERVKGAYQNPPSPYFSMHPTLHYIVTPTSNAFYTLGLEGVRYLPGWTDDTVRAALGGGRPLILLMGGSTTMGHGVGDGDTIAAHLQDLLGETAWVLNLGAGAYDQNREVERLVYLLRQGVRPTAVLFLDGVNDIYGMARSNYRWIDKVIYHGFVAGKGDVTRGDKAFTIGKKDSVRPRDFAIMLAQALPLSRYVIERMMPRFDPTLGKAELNSFVSKFDYAEQEYRFYNWAILGDRDLDLHKRQILEEYVNNGAFLHGLAASFGFKLFLFYQPNGIVDPNNVTTGSPAPNLAGYRYIHGMHNAVRAAIAAAKIPLIDLTDGFGELGADHKAYIDVVHYSPQGNRSLARLYQRYLVSAGVVK